MQRSAVVVAVLVVAALSLPVAAGSAAAAQSCSFPVTKTDGSGTEVTLEEEPQRVVTLNPSVAQIMWEIGAREKVVGVSKYASYLEGAEDREVISGEEQFVVHEKVVELEPDLVLAPNTISNETVEKLRDAGLTVYHFPEAETIEDVYEKTMVVGELTGECEGARETVDWMQERIGVVDEAVAGQERPDVLYLFFGYTAGEGTFINEIIRAAGGTNVAAEVGIESYRQMSEEVIVEQDPDWIILNSNDPALPESDAINQTTAVREGQVVVVQIEQLNQPAPRIVHAITQLAQQFHPKAYAAANTTARTAASVMASSGLYLTMVFLLILLMAKTPPLRLGKAL
jgi:iron complex transport system substrate-binding protein